jgi:hypothetical protein
MSSSDLKITDSVLAILGGSEVDACTPDKAWMSGVSYNPTDQPWIVRGGGSSNYFVFCCLYGLLARMRFILLWSGSVLRGWFSSRGSGTRSER